VTSKELKVNRRGDRYERDEPRSCGSSATDILPIHILLYDSLFSYE
jgi:hypothetical protein